VRAFHDRLGRQQISADVRWLPPDMRARGRNGLLIGLMALLPLLAFAGFAVLTSLASYRSADETRLRSTARALASAVDAELGRYVAVLETLASSPLLDDPVNVEALEARFRVVGEAWGGWIALVDQPPDYQILATTRRESGGPLPSAIPPGLPPTRGESIAGVFRDGRPALSDLFVGR
jgi:hypothetical protein